MKMLRLRCLPTMLGLLITAGCAGLSPNESGSQLPIGTAMTPTTQAVVQTNQTFLYTGMPQRFKVPTGVTQVTVIAVGAAGGGTTTSYAHPGGRGGRVYAVVPVKQNETLYVYVGGSTKDSSGGFNGGAGGEYSSYVSSFGGGGASDVREGGQSLTDRIIVAGAGGGAGASDYSDDSGPGGLGGSRIGGRGANASGNGSGEGGRGGTQTHGGLGGKRGSGYYGYGQHGKRGALGLGGDGGGIGCSNSCYSGGGGGGGGGGYYGGGGGGSGGSQTSHTGSGGGGGGGSSYVESRAKGVRMYQGWNDAVGNGTVTIKWK
jgi:hypothetical protein